MNSLATKKMISLAILVFWLMIMPGTASAGPLLDWMRSKCNRNKPTNVDIGGLQATSGSFTQALTTLQPGQCQQTCMQTCQKVSVNYVPYTAYRTNWQRVPVTQYRPVTSTDPRSGCVVTCMKPCTNYSWQLQRVPYTTYRPVYKTSSYQVPVTTISNDCENGGCSTYSTCDVPNAGMQNGFVPGNVVPGNGGGFMPGATGATSVPADGIPVLSSANRPIYGMNGSYPVPGNYQAYSAPNGAVYPQANNYAAPGAYAGMTTYSGYEVNGVQYSDSNYNPPMPSSNEAPMPGVPSSGVSGGSLKGARPTPADQKPILQDLDSTTGNGLNTPAIHSALGDAEAKASPMNDPTPEMRWDYNVPPLVRPEDQSAHRDVQMEWAYNPIQLASYSQPAPAAANDRGVHRQVNPVHESNTINDQWQSSGNASNFGGVNSEWN